MEQGRPEDLFELLEQLGKGSYGAVYKVRARPTTLAAPPVHRVSVTCPPDKPPGSQLLVKVPSGQTIRATVPQRLGPGRSFTVVAPAAPVAPPAVPNVSLSQSASLDLSAPSAAASGTAGLAKKFAKEVAKDYAWDQAKGCGKEVLASIVSSDSMADASGFLLGM